MLRRSSPRSYQPEKREEEKKKARKRRPHSTSNTTMPYLLPHLRKQPLVAVLLAAALLLPQQLLSSHGGVVCAFVVVAPSARSSAGGAGFVAASGSSLLRPPADRGAAASNVNAAGAGAAAGAGCARRRRRRRQEMLLYQRRSSVDEETKNEASSATGTDGTDGHFSSQSPQESTSTSAFAVINGGSSSDDVDEWVQESKTVELLLLGGWGVALSAFILVNNFFGPWPASILTTTPERVFFLAHMVGGMLFGGGIILTTAIEWLVVKNANSAVLQFWFDKVPLLDGLIVVPALTVSMISGTGLSVRRYGDLGHAPPHVVAVFYALIAFCAWWAITDLTTQGKALVAVNESAIQQVRESVNGGRDDEENKSQPPNPEPGTVVVPSIVEDRWISNVVSCMFVGLLYFIMVMKPGTLFWQDLFK